jgi:BirA family biotin operon repressor/biotin-[acetyl-CoA-carboxylase] ligase
VSLPSPAGEWRLKVVEVLTSTSDLCRTLAEAGEPDGVAVLARRQTQARGSRGRSWAAPVGNLFLSVLLRPHDPARDAAQWSLLAGVALADALAPIVPSSASVKLKWPNDVLLDERKLAGILVESATDTRGELRYIVIGIGVNLAVAPDLPDRRAACLAELGKPPGPEEFASELLSRIGHWRRVRLLEGFAPIRTAWHARAASVGTHMTLRHDGQVLGGAYAGLGEDGSLLLQTGGRVRAFTTGEVLLGQEPPCSQS